MVETFETAHIAGYDIKLAHDPVFTPLVYNQSSQLLAETFALDTPAAQVAVLASAADAFTLWLARRLGESGGRVLAIDDNAAATDYVRRNLALNGITNVSILSRKEAGGAWDAAILNIVYQSNSQVISAWLKLGYDHLKPGALLLLAGAKNRGIMGAGKRLEDVFGNARTAVYRQGNRIFVATRPATDNLPPPPPPRLPDHIETADINGVPTLLHIRDGVFASGQLDPATALLIEHIRINPADTILDLGCGAGILGIAAARLAPEGRAVLVDTDAGAVDLANANIAANTIINASTHVSDSTAAVRDTLFDVVLTNPPFHFGRVQTNAIAERFIRDAAEVLRDGGRFYVVANAFIKYEDKLRDIYNNVTEVANSGQYKVLMAIKEGKRERRKRLIAEAATQTTKDDAEWEELKASIERP